MRDHALTSIIRAMASILELAPRLGRGLRSLRARCGLPGLVALALLGCPTQDPDPPDDPGPFAEGVDGLSHGVGLSAWSDGEDLLVVGGRLSDAPGESFGGPGRVIRISPDLRACKAYEAPQTLWWIHGREPGDWYAVGEGGTIIHHQQDGTLVDESVSTDAILYGVWAASDRVIAVGGDPFTTMTGEVWQRDAGGAWSLLAGDLPGVAFKVWEDWIVGVGVAWQLEGDTLVEHHPPNGERLLTVRGRGPEEVYAVGGFGEPVVLRWDGSAWSSVEIDPGCVSGGLNGVWTAAEEDLWIAGFFGAAARHDGERWTCTDDPLSLEHYHAVWRHQGETWWVGGDLLSSGGEQLSLASTAGLLPTEVLDACE